MRTPSAPGATALPRLTGRLATIVSIGAALALTGFMVPAEASPGDHPRVPTSDRATVDGVVYTWPEHTVVGDEQVCPSTSDAPKVDVRGEELTLDVAAPAGKEIVGYCVKSGSAQSGGGVRFVTLDEPVESVTIAYPQGTKAKAISHYAVFCRDATPSPKPTEPTESTEPTEPTEPTVPSEENPAPEENPNPGTPDGPGSNDGESPDGEPQDGEPQDGETPVENPGDETPAGETPAGETAGGDGPGEESAEDDTTGDDAAPIVVPVAEPAPVAAPLVERDLAPGGGSADDASSNGEGAQLVTATVAEAGQELPATGAQVVGLVIAAVVLVAIGTLGVYASRRRSVEGD